jgi:hypothetical protein
MRYGSDYGYRGYDRGCHGGRGYSYRYDRGWWRSEPESRDGMEVP